LRFPESFSDTVAHVFVGSLGKAHLMSLLHCFTARSVLFLRFPVLAAAGCFALASESGFAENVTQLELQAVRATFGKASIEDTNRDGSKKSFNLPTQGFQTFPNRLTALMRSDDFELQLTRFFDVSTGYVGLGLVMRDIGFVLGLGSNFTWGEVSKLTRDNIKYTDNPRGVAAGPYLRWMAPLTIGNFELRGEVHYVRDLSKTTAPIDEKSQPKSRYLRDANGFETDWDAKLWWAVHRNASLGTGVNLFYKAMEDRYSGGSSLKNSKRSDIAIGLNLANVRLTF
jgi:hypothetical protein